MLPMEVTQIATAVSGVWRDPRPDAPPVCAVSTDSRHIPSAACLFIPLVGEKFDGHDFIDAAFDGGASACLFSRTPAAWREDKIYIEVPDTRIALGDLSAAYRDRFPIPFVQITGSVGKTTTKEMIAAVLETTLSILKTPENWNNDIGVPQTLLSLAPEHQAAVIETGMNHVGEIAYLGRLIRPDIAVICNIGDAHIENLGSRENILKAKCEIFQHLRPDGVAVLNGDDPLLEPLELPFRTVRCGYSERAQVRIIDFFDYGVRGIACTVQTEQDIYPLTIPAPGNHMVYPAAVAVAVGEELGLDRASIIRGVAAYTPAGSRMRILTLRGKRIVLDDCYNANPQSVTAALEVLARTECDKRVAVLGDMGELGGISAQAHYNVGALTAMLGIDFVIAIGEKAVGIAEGAAQNGGDVGYFKTKEEAEDELVRQLEAGSAMLIKASHAMRFDTLVTRLRERYEKIS